MREERERKSEQREERVRGDSEKGEEEINGGVIWMKRVNGGIIRMRRRRKEERNMEGIGKQMWTRKEVYGSVKKVKERPEEMR